jgi:triphosphoribosyl-dephospho-CoA synthase
MGQTILAAVKASVAATHGRNVHLGSILALAPLVYGYTRGSQWPAGVQAVIEELTLDDTAAVFRAIRITHPTWLAPGTAVDDDVYQSPRRPLIDVFRAAQDYDWIAREYVRHFSTVFDTWAPYLEKQLQDSGHWPTAVERTFYQMLLHEPDSLWIRKNGWETAARQHQKVVAAILAGDQHQLSELLEDPQNRWNPGTTADLIGAAIFVVWVRRWVL